MGIYVGNKRYALLVGSTRRKMMIENALPYDAEIEYLETNGNQMIDSGIISDEPTELEVDILITSLSGGSAASVCLIGTREVLNPGSGNTTKKRISIWLSVNRIALNLYNYDSGYKSEPVVIKNYRRIIAYKNSILSVDGSTALTKAYAGDNNEKGHIGILKVKLADGTWDTASNRGISGKLYGVKIWKDSVLVGDFIPVRVGQIGYLYNKVDKTLHGNEGTGDFVLGNDIT